MRRLGIFSPFIYKFLIYFLLIVEFPILTNVHQVRNVFDEIFPKSINSKNN